MQFKVGDKVKTNEDVPREGTVQAVTTTGEYRVCFDAAGTDCAVFRADQLTPVQKPA